MSMLSSQVDELREAARNIQGKLGRCRYRRKDIDEMQQVCDMLFEAADTIESLRKQVAKCQIAELKADYDTSRYFKFFGTPERAARTLERLDEMSCKYCLLHDYCGDSCLLYKKDDALLEWLRGDAE